MIERQELEQLRGEWSLESRVIEKDYALGWLLAGIAHHEALSQTWIFKGGTCLRKCYYETYRFSEDLDFTVTRGGPEDPTTLTQTFKDIVGWVRENSGLELVIDETSFRLGQNRRGNPTIQGRVAYRGPNPPSVLPKIKIDVTSDELIMESPALRAVGHPYSDAPLPIPGVLCYSPSDLLAEKVRALAERCRPRDLYDVIHMYRHPELVGRRQDVLTSLSKKCEYVGIEVPTCESILSSPFRSEIEVEWVNMLGHQLPKPLPGFAQFWDGLNDLFAWLSGDLKTPILRRASQNGLDEAWEPPKAISSWRAGFPLELIRYAGANRLKVEIDYRANEGRSGPRIVEPYSLRRTLEGNILLFVINDRGDLRAYRIDRIAGASVTSLVFTPKYLVEF
ncbi:MAG: nucleotidyl transferase AbiEii/AbiGii toxin family protein [Acidimicrobiales bacterium]